jgi:hypothetical protein
MSLSDQGSLWVFSRTLERLTWLLFEGVWRRRFFRVLLHDVDEQ